MNHQHEQAPSDGWLAAIHWRVAPASEVTANFQVVGAIHCRLFVRYLRSRSIDPAPLLARVELVERDLERPKLLLSTASFLGFLRLCLEATDDSELGLRAGSLVGLEDIDLADPIVLTTLPGSEQCALGVRPVVAHDSVLATTQQGLVCRQLRFSRRAMPKVWGEYFAARTVTLARLVAPQLQPVAVRFMHPRPARTGVHNHMFRAVELTFGEPDNEVVFSSSAQAAAFADFGRLARVVTKQEPPADRVRLLLSKNIDCKSLCAGKVASLLGQNERTLRRRLLAEGTSYRALLDQVRYEIARRHLDAGLKPAEISRLVGYRDPRAFYRSFKRWTGETFRRRPPLTS